jgi:biotin transport system permease protein
MDEITSLARPLEKTGLVRADDIGLAVGLVIRFVPEILGRYTAIREAHIARGLKVRPATILVPLIILTLKDADNIAAAIDARGIRRHSS